ncbi:MAG: hypothetical protein ABW019_10625 [Chitinophagaceae bacterium]
MTHSNLFQKVSHPITAPHVFNYPVMDPGAGRRAPRLLITTIYNADGTVVIYGDHVEQDNGGQKPDAGCDSSYSIGWLTGEA